MVEENGILFSKFFGPSVKPFTTETSQRRYDRSLRRIHVDGQSFGPAKHFQIKLGQAFFGRYNLSLLN